VVKFHFVNQRRFITFFVSLFILSVSLIIANAKTPEFENKRSDIIYIDLPDVPDSENMQPVSFFHDRHTEALKEEGCNACHPKNPKKKNTFVFKFKRIKNSKTKTDMEIYHKNCISCHTEKKAAGVKGGPVKGECRVCHNSELKTGSSWKALIFDKSMHYTHEQSKLIPSSDGANCQACHHIVDEKSKKVYYKKGEEGSCRYCHFPGGKKDVSSIKEASHSACVNCHQFVQLDKKSGGPTICKGCHDVIEQEKIKILTRVPRLKRNQPDNVLITGYGDQAKLSENLVNASMNPVAFNHKIHESSVESCKSCHHESLKGCRDCHTVSGDKKGNFISLESAMHNKTSQSSCVSCHNNKKKENECAGCHSIIPEKNFSHMACSQCHEVDKSQIAIDSSPDMNAMMKLAGKTTELRSKSYNDISGKISEKVIPEKVIIDILSDEYKPVDFPHLQMFNQIKTRIEKSSLARAFHKDDKTLCMGCHHYSPSSLTPVKCQSCHSKAGKPNDNRPDLKAAYHGQCISCHNKMKIEKPAGTDCVSCHLKKEIVTAKTN